MKMHVYSVYDTKAKVFSQPNFLLNKGVALRAWEQAANDPQNSISQNPGDYTMFEIGTWDDEKGEFQNHPAKISLGLAVEFVRANRPQPTASPMSPSELSQ